MCQAQQSLNVGYQKSSFLKAIVGEGTEALETMKLMHFKVKETVKLATIFRYEGMFLNALMEPNASVGKDLGRNELASAAGDKRMSQEDLHPGLVQAIRDLLGAPTAKPSGAKLKLS